jgi:hypothetical protein
MVRVGTNALLKKIGRMSTIPDCRTASTLLPSSPIPAEIHDRQKVTRTVTAIAAGRPGAGPEAHPDHHHHPDRAAEHRSHNVSGKHS